MLSLVDSDCWRN